MRAGGWQAAVAPLLAFEQNCAGHPVNRGRRHHCSFNLLACSAVSDGNVVVNCCSAAEDAQFFEESGLILMAGLHF